MKDISNCLFQLILVFFDFENTYCEMLISLSHKI